MRGCQRTERRRSALTVELQRVSTGLTRWVGSRLGCELTAEGVSARRLPAHRPYRSLISFACARRSMRKRSGSDSTSASSPSPSARKCPPATAKETLAQLNLGYLSLSPVDAGRIVGSFCPGSSFHGWASHVQEHIEGRDHQAALRLPKMKRLTDFQSVS